MAELFQTSKQNVAKHLKSIFAEAELDPASVVNHWLTTAADGKNYRVAYYNLDAILAVGYRVRSARGTQFRRWATERLREYLVKGFTLDDERLKNPSVAGSAVPDRFDELLERIRNIRASERRMYLRVRGAGGDCARCVRCRGTARGAVQRLHSAGIAGAACRRGGRIGLGAAGRDAALSRRLPSRPDRQRQARGDARALAGGSYWRVPARRGAHRQARPCADGIAPMVMWY